ncbi:hypothetical protein ACFQX6_25830 [Streptosporangium lutulentum]
MNPAIVAFIRGIDRETVQRMEGLSDQGPRGIVNVSDNLAARVRRAPNSITTTAW